MKKAIVIGYGVSSLGVIRSLGLKGFRIVSLYYDRTDFAQASRYVHEGVEVPDPTTEEDNYDQLMSNFNLCSESGQQVMVQDIIPGPATTMYNYTVYVNSKGKVNARFLRLKIRQNPPQFGITRIGISHDRVSEVEKFTERLLEEAEFKGIAAAEFKRDPRDNSFKLLEISARTIRSNWLSTNCGVNFPWVAYMDLVEKKQNRDQRLPQECLLDRPKCGYI